MTDETRAGKDQVNFRCPPILRRWLDERVEDGTFTTRTEAIVYYLTVAKQLEDTERKFLAKLGRTE